MSRFHSHGPASTCHCIVAICCHNTMNIVTTTNMCCVSCARGARDYLKHAQVGEFIVSIPRIK